MCRAKVSNHVVVLSNHDVILTLPLAGLTDALAQTHLLPVPKSHLPVSFSSDLHAETVNRTVRKFSHDPHEISQGLYSCPVGSFGPYFSSSFLRSSLM